MKQTIKIFVILAVMMVTTGQVWGGNITTSTVDGGTLKFYTTYENGMLWGTTATYNAGSVYYIQAKPDEVHTIKDMSATNITVEKSGGTEIAEAPRRTSVGVTVDVYQAMDGETPIPGIFYFTMPTDGTNVIVSATFPDKGYMENVSYVGWNATSQESIPNAVTPNGTKVWVLDGTETTLGKNGTDTNNKPYETWYICNTAATANNGSGLSYTHYLELFGNVHLIIADDAAMTVNSNTTLPLISDDNDLAIYGQTDGTGLLTVTGNGTAINSYGNLTISNCKVTAKGRKVIYANKDIIISNSKVTAEDILNGNAIYANDNVTITGSEVKATSTTSGFGIFARSGSVTITNSKVTAESSDRGIYANDNVTITGSEVIAKATSLGSYGIRSDLITINGGNVTAEGSYCGIYAVNDVTINGGKVMAKANNLNSTYPGISSLYGYIVLGWTKASDYIYASSYKAGKAVKVAAGQRFAVYTPTGTPGTEGFDPSVTGTAINFTIGDATSTEATAIATDISLTDATATKTIAGKTLKPQGLNTVTAPADITFSNYTSTFTVNNTTYYTYGMSDEVTIEYTGDNLVTLGGLPEGITFSNVEGQPMQRTFTMGSEDIVLTLTAVTGLTVSGTYTYNSDAKEPVIKQGENVFAATNYTIAYKQNSTTVSEAKNAGTYTCLLTGKGVYIGTATLTDALTIERKGVSLTGEIIARNKTYDGNNTASLVYSSVVIDGKVEGDDLTITATGTFTDKDAGALRTVTISNIALAGTDKDNYTIDNSGIQTKTTANIYKQNLLVTAKPKTISYGDDPDNDGVTITGFVEGEGPSVLQGTLRYDYNTAEDGTGTAYAAGSPTGTYYIIPDGLSNNNYRCYCYAGILTVDAKDISYEGGTITQDENGYTVSIDESTGSPKPLPIGDGNIASLTYSRTLTAPAGSDGDKTIGDEAANLVTICLPFAPKTGEGIKYYTLSNVIGSTLIFSEVTTPAANTPYLVAVTGSTDITESCNDAAVTSMEIASTTVGGYTFKGSFKGMTNDEAAGKYILQHGGKWGKVPAGNANIYLPPFRAYIESASDARSLGSEISDSSTDIQYIRTTDADGTETWYDLQGRSLEGMPTKQGLYINNGKKVMVK